MGTLLSTVRSVQLHFIVFCFKWVHHHYSYPNLSSPTDLKRFYIHRLFEFTLIFAVVISALFVSIGFLFWMSDFSEVRRPFEISYDLHKRRTFSLVKHTLKHLTFSQSLSIEALKLVFNGPLWSLVLEVYFYIAFPVLLFVLRPFNSFGYLRHFLSDMHFNFS